MLGEERRPWLDLATLKQKYQKLALALHPDTRPKGHDADDFAVIIEAHRVLTEPRLRLRHLLQLEGVQSEGKQPVPHDLADFFPRLAKVLQQTDALLAKSATATNALGKSLLRAEVVQQQAAIKTNIVDLQQLEDESLADLRDLNDSWRRDRPATLRRLQEIHQRLAYLTRWLQQLREREFQLSVTS